MKGNEKEMENITESKKDVFLRRGIWYVTTLLSILGLCITLNLLWPHGDSSSSSLILRDVAVSTTTFYTVTLLRHLIFTDPAVRSACYNKVYTFIERIPQILFSVILIIVEQIWTGCYSWTSTKTLYISLFIVSFLTGGIGLMQLSDKLRMEMRHAYLTLSLVWLFSLFGIFEGLRSHPTYPGDIWTLSVAVCQDLTCFGIIWFNYIPKDVDSSLPA